MASTASPSLLHEVLNAYLAPLLKKHDAGKPIIFEDLQRSYSAASSICSANPQNGKVREKLDQLHQSQSREYQKHATASTQQWFMTTRVLAMPKPEEGVASAAYVKTCVAWALKNLMHHKDRPNYHLDDAETVLPRIVQQAIQARATRRFLAVGAANASPNKTQESSAAAANKGASRDEEAKKESQEDDEPAGDDEEVEDGEEKEANDGDVEEGEEQEEDNDDAMTTITEEEDGELDEEEEDGELDEDIAEKEDQKKQKTTPAKNNTKKVPVKPRPKVKGGGNKGKSNTSTTSTNKASSTTAATMRNKKALGGKRKPLPAKALGKAGAAKRQRAAKANK